MKKFIANFHISIPFNKQIHTKKDAEKALKSLYNDLSVGLANIDFAADSKVVEESVEGVNEGKPTIDFRIEYMDEEKW